MRTLEILRDEGNIKLVLEQGEQKEADKVARWIVASSGYAVIYDSFGVKVAYTSQFGDPFPL